MHQMTGECEQSIDSETDQMFEAKLSVPVLRDVVWKKSRVGSIAQHNILREK